ncbi:MoxR family ATPase [Akkermansiaceae bacterium]|jgi:MoxR-like ATPase|nr:AAA family ATPase [Marinovum sp.]MBT4799638.1 MoxR family ATPase [Verrucomicrobiota bacterium]MDA7499550.1 MoxR family ATPase [Akkermansiaceae bacterium]MDA7516526.1 MoxR family ATPase [bacterium]MBT6168027.1 MoxR family ATPase [Verrucomicrobiota bacterium]|tara:strand:+ start:221 stop:1246 length:1026 start_codon:yes stop_codon:yes gene_type:complete
MTDKSDDIQAVENLGEARDAIITELRKTIVGMDDVIDEMMIAIFSRGHSLLVGVPGLAKTLLVSSLAETMSLGFKRIQFTPDLMPSDITGTELLQEDPETHERRFKFQKGPVFTNLLLADEINRTPPKTQAALLEAMQEKRVSSGGEEYKLDEPFFVLATQNPIEQEGTYPLPEAQLDRFLFNIMVKYPSHSEELDIMRSVTTDDVPEVKKVVDAATIIEFQHVVRRIPVSEHVFEYAAALVRATRPNEKDAPDFVKKLMAWGAGPRASLNLIIAGKARAALRGRCHVSIEDIQALCLPILRHRVIPNFAARSEGETSDTLIAKLIEEVPSDEKLLKKQSS